MNRKLTIDEMRAIAKKRGGRCLSRKYKGVNRKLRWRCTKGHVWHAVPSSIKVGTWCPLCSYVDRGQARKLDIAKIHLLAAKHSGKFLSKEYVNARTKYLWQCAEGHIWEATQNNVKKGQWCPKCGIKKAIEKRKLDVALMHQIAAERGGKFLSKEYIDSNTNHLWQCSKGHIWEATPTHVKNNLSWCPHCVHRTNISPNRTRLTIEEMQRIAMRKGGECLSKKYINAKTKLKWSCIEGHTWWATPINVKYLGHWCVECHRENMRSKRSWKRADRKPSNKKVPWEI